jgi:hypothetical protein
MRIRRRLPIPLAVLLIVAAIALIVTLRKHAPPEAARLLLRKSEVDSDLQRHRSTAPGFPRARVPEVC